jgi:nucleoid-associated protein YgaU
MGRRMAAFMALALASAVALAADAAETGGKIELPLSRYEEMLDQVEAEDVAAPPEIPVARLERRIDGVFSKGLFRGQLVERFEVLEAKGHVRVPVLDGEVSLAEVSLDGKRTSLLREGDMYTLGVGEAGVHEVRLVFYAGENQERFARRLSFALPEGGVTSLKVVVPESDIEAELGAGALVRTTQVQGGTLLEGYLDSEGRVDLSWTRRATHKGDQKTRMEARINTLFTIGEASVTGESQLDYTVLEGETDVVALDLPSGVEVLAVEGEPVLQWRTEGGSGGKLVVLLRYLVADKIEFKVRFQLPASDAGGTKLAQPLPTADVPFSGAAGVIGPAGLDVRPDRVENAAALEPGDYPPELAALSGSPLLYGFSFTRAPSIGVTAARRSEVALTSTLVEELQASTVLAADGFEVTKTKLKIRNNTREFLAVRLPAGAQLTHCLVEGEPVRPARGEGGALLVPLRQSERLGDGSRREHKVRPGETLSDIANLYYSDPGKWPLILSANPGELSSPAGVTSGQTLQIPAAADVVFEESSFVVEMAYKVKRDPLGALGRVGVSLPALDVDTMRVTWHVYFPTSLEPVGFDANLTQYSAIRYDLFTRIRDFLYDALAVRDAWAGEKYENILAQRKVIYRDEAVSQAQDEAIRTEFPLVGAQYRFKRILLGRETPSITVTYLDRDWDALLKLAALVAAFAATTALLYRFRSLRVVIIAAVALVALLVVAHFVLGVHRRLLWGADLAMIAALLRARGGPLRERAAELLAAPWRFVEILSVRNLLFMVGALAAISFVIVFPLLTSATAAAVMLVLWVRHSRAAKEVRHA